MNPGDAVESSARSDAALRRLRDGGERLTPARLAVVRVVAAADVAGEHLSAEQIGARVSEVEPSVHRATVYRTLTSLCEAGVLSHVHLGGSGTVYHLVAEAPDAPDVRDVQAKRGPHDHAHVQCSTCDRVFDIAPDVLTSAQDRLRDDLGFTLDTHHAALLGTCADCRADDSADGSLTGSTDG